MPFRAVACAIWAPGRGGLGRDYVIIVGALHSFFFSFFFWVEVAIVWIVRWDEEKG